MKRILSIAMFMMALTGPPVRCQSITATDTLRVHSMRGTYYSDKFVGRKTSSGEVFRQDRYTAAHRSLKFGTLVLVTNPKNGQQVIVKINDRCPINNVIDLTRTAARAIGIGSSIVHVQVLPERYYPYWEQQNQLQDVMKKGEFLTYVQHPYSDDTNSLENNSERRSKGAVVQAMPPSQSKDKQPTANNKTTKEKKSAPESTGKTPQTDANSQADKKTQSDIENNALYNIQLGHYPSRNTAEKEVRRLPIYYQDLVTFKTRVNSNDVVVILELQAQHEQAQKARLELANMFPEAELIQKK